MRPVVARRTRVAAAVLAVSLSALTGCSSGKSAPKPTTAAAGVCPPVAPLASPATVSSKTPGSDQFGQRAKIDVPAGDPTGKLVVTVVNPAAAHGPAIAKGNLVILNFTGKLWRDGTDLGSSYDSGGAGPVSLVPGTAPAQMLAGWDEALIGKQAGTRVEVIVPPDKGLGPTGRPADTNNSIAITGTDTMIFMLDIIGVYDKPTDDIPPGTGTIAAADPSLPTVGADVDKGDPKIIIPAGRTAPTCLVSKVVIQGAGATVKQGQTVVMQYEGVLWKNGSIFDSSWSSGKKQFATTIGVGSVVKGWDEGLIGQQVGSRVLLVIPPALGYGPQGQGPIGATDTMVFAVDILAAG